MMVSRALANRIAPGDELSCALPDPSGTVAAEIYVCKQSRSIRASHLYLAPVCYVTKPRKDKRDQFFVAAEIGGGRLGLSSVFLPSDVLRQYFFHLPRGQESQDGRILYDILRSSPRASPGELRLAFRLRQLEFEAARAPRADQTLLERAFNILGDPELRACYDSLLADPEAPAVFPYGGVGSLLVSGDRSRDGQTFFAREILSFTPELRERHFHAALRRCDFYDDRALYHDLARKLNLWLDPSLLLRVWDATWNQWKHLLATKVAVRGSFVLTRKYRQRRGQWEFAEWETALPSRIEIKLPADIDQQITAAQSTHHRFGQYSETLERIRTRLEYEPVEKSELERMCVQLGIPGDFDAAKTIWRPDYQDFFYRQLARRARRTYLFRDEYIFQLERAVVAETPCLGNATYVFAKPRNMESFLAAYVKVSKEDIRRNRDNVGETLRFVGRVIHGTKQPAWLSDLKRRIGEKHESAPCDSVPVIG
jgi:curved DNA-binding protein CbpA